MNTRTLFKAMIIISLILFSNALKASENDNCLPYTPEIVSCKIYTEEELSSIRSSNNPNLIMGAGIVQLVISPKLTVGEELLNLSSKIESPKGIATISLSILQLNDDSPLKPYRENIIQLLLDDKENALSYYLNALLQEEEGRDQEAIALIKKGNTKILNTYPKQRFYAIIEAGKLAKCTKIQAQQYALRNSLSTSVYKKLRQLCQKLIASHGQEAKNACYLMGQNLEWSSLTIIEKLNSLAIQEKSLEDSSHTEVHKKFKEKREQLLDCIKSLDPIPETDVTEDADLKYDEIYLESGECSALKFLSNFVKQKRKEK